MEESILGLDAASVFGEKQKKERHDIQILDNKIILISKEALFDLIKTGWFWEPKPSDDIRIEKIVDDIKQKRGVEIGPINTRYRRIIHSETDIISGLETAMNGRWPYFDNRFPTPSFTTPNHIKKCFEAFLKNEKFDEGKAELLMKIILCGDIGDIRDLTANGIVEVERERTELSDEKERESSKEIKTESLKSPFNGLSGFLKKKMEALKYTFKNEWEPKYIGGRLVVTQHGRKYKVVAFSTKDSDKIVVWDKSGAVVKSASWEGSTIVLFCGFGSIHLYGPNNNDY